MLSNIGKAEMDEHVRKMKAAASLSKDSFVPKRKAPVEVAPVQSQDEQTNLDLVFKRKRREAASLEQSNSDGRAPHQEVIAIQECVSESSCRKSLWDADFDVLAHGKAFFLSLKNKNRLPVHYEDFLCRDSLKLFSQAFAWSAWLMKKCKITKCLKTTKIRRSLSSAKEWIAFRWRSTNLITCIKKLSISTPRRPERHLSSPKRWTSFWVR